MDANEKRRIIEALILASPDPISAAKLADLIPYCTTAQAKDLVNELNTQYQEQDRSFEIWEVAGGYQIRTRAEFSGYLQKLRKTRALRLSRAALESLVEHGEELFRRVLRQKAEGAHVDAQDRGAFDGQDEVVVDLRLGPEGAGVVRRDGQRAPRSPRKAHPGGAGEVEAYFVAPVGVEGDRVRLALLAALDEACNSLVEQTFRRSGSRDQAARVQLHVTLLNPASGQRPPVLVSANVPEGDAHNQQIVEQYVERRYRRQQKKNGTQQILASDSPP